MDADQIREIFNGVLDDRNRVDAETHESHHLWLSERIECYRRRRAIAERVIQHVLGWSAVLGIGWLGAAILKAVRGN